MNRGAFIAHLNLHGWIAAKTNADAFEYGTDPRKWPYYFCSPEHPLVMSKGIGKVMLMTNNPLSDMYDAWRADRYMREWAEVPNVCLAELAVYLGVSYDP